MKVPQKRKLSLLAERCNVKILRNNEVTSTQFYRSSSRGKPLPDVSLSSRNNGMAAQDTSYKLVKTYRTLNTESGLLFGEIFINRALAQR